MSKLSVSQLDDANSPTFLYQLHQDLRRIVDQVNGMSDVKMAFYTTADAIPGAPGAPGEIRWKREPVETGTATNKIVMHGWRYVGSAWLEMQMKTGN